MMVASGQMQAAGEGSGRGREGASGEDARSPAPLPVFLQPSAL